MTYSFKCNCGEVMTVEAENREEAVTKMKGMMTQDAINTHMSEKHSGEPVPTLEQVHAQIDSNLVEGDLRQKSEDTGMDQAGQTPAPVPAEPVAPAVGNPEPTN